MKRNLPILLIALSIFSANSFANYDAALAAIKKKDYAKVFVEAKASADEGDPRAQELLGELYQYGKGVPVDMNQSIYWYQKAAYSGDQDAQTNLASIYIQTSNDKYKIKEALGWLRDAAEKGHLFSQIFLGDYYSKELPENNYQPRSKDYAAYWYSKAGKQGHEYSKRYAEMVERERKSKEDYENYVAGIASSGNVGQVFRKNAENKQRINNIECDTVRRSMKNNANPTTAKRILAEKGCL